jgi:large subunit ribosomal protein L7/L12
MAEVSRKQILESISAMSTLELADLVKDIEETFGVSAAMTMSVAAPVAGGAVAEQSEEKLEYKVTLEQGGAEKIKSIKALRAAMPEMNLTDAKKAVEEAPTVLAESAPKDLAKKIKEALEAAGAKVTLS